MGDRLTLETADVEWHPSSEPGSMLPASDGGELAEVRDELARILGLDPGPGSDDIGDLLTTVRVRLRGPTEGASDADVAAALDSIDDILDTPYVGAELANDINGHLDVIRNAIASTAPLLPAIGQRPPTGGASPTGNAAGDLALQIAPVLTRQRDRAQARLDALIGAVEAFIAGQKLAREGASFIGASGRVECYTGTIDALAVMVDAAKAD